MFFTGGKCLGRKRVRLQCTTLPSVNVVALEVEEREDGVGDDHDGDEIVKEGERQEHVREGHAAHRLI